MNENNFVEANDHVMIDPVAKIILSDGRVDLDNNVSFHVEFDPEILEDELHFSSDREIPRSSKRIKLPDICCTRAYRAAEGVSIIWFAFDDLEVIASIIVRKIKFYDRIRAVALYANLIDQITKMRVWDDLVRGWNKNNPQSPISRLRFDISHTFARYLKAQIGKEFRPLSDTQCLLAERDARP